MSKFNRGDKVRCVEADSVYFTIGNEYLVTSGSNSATGLQIKDNDGDVISPALSRFELVTDTPRPDQLQWLKARIEDGYGDTGYNAALMDVLRIFHGIAATPTTVTRIEWIFSAVQP